MFLIKLISFLVLVLINTSSSAQDSLGKQGELLWFDVTEGFIELAETPSSRKGGPHWIPLKGNSNLETGSTAFKYDGSSESSHFFLMGDQKIRILKTDFARTTTVRKFLKDKKPKVRKVTVKSKLKKGEVLQIEMTPEFFKHVKIDYGPHKSPRWRRISEKARKVFQDTNERFVFEKSDASNHYFSLGSTLVQIPRNSYESLTQKKNYTDSEAVFKGFNYWPREKQGSQGSTRNYKLNSYDQLMKARGESFYIAVRGHEIGETLGEKPQDERGTVKPGDRLDYAGRSSAELFYIKNDDELIGIPWDQFKSMTSHMKLPKKLSIEDFPFITKKGKRLKSWLGEADVLPFYKGVDRNYLKACLQRKKDLYISHSGNRPHRQADHGTCTGQSAGGCLEQGLLRQDRAKGHRPILDNVKHHAILVEPLYLEIVRRRFASDNFKTGEVAVHYGNVAVRTKSLFKGSSKDVEDIDAKFIDGIHSKNYLPEMASLLARPTNERSAMYTAGASRDGTSYIYIERTKDSERIAHQLLDNMDRKLKDVISKTFDAYRKAKPELRLSLNAHDSKGKQVKILKMLKDASDGDIVNTHSQTELAALFENYSYKNQQGQTIFPTARMQEIILETIGIFYGDDNPDFQAMKVPKNLALPKGILPRSSLRKLSSRNLFFDSKATPSRAARKTCDRNKILNTILTYLCSGIDLQIGGYFDSLSLGNHSMSVRGFRKADEDFPQGALVLKNSHGNSKPYFLDYDHLCEAYILDYFGNWELDRKLMENVNSVKRELRNFPELSIGGFKTESPMGFPLPEYHGEKIR